MRLLTRSRAGRVRGGRRRLRRQVRAADREARQRARPDRPELRHAGDLEGPGRDPATSSDARDRLAAVHALQHRRHRRAGGAARRGAALPASPSRCRSERRSSSRCARSSIPWRSPSAQSKLFVLDQGDIVHGQVRRRSAARARRTRRCANGAAAALIRDYRPPGGCASTALRGRRHGLHVHRHDVRVGVRHRRGRRRVRLRLRRRGRARHVARPTRASARASSSRASTATRAGPSTRAIVAERPRTCRAPTGTATRRGSCWTARATSSSSDPRGIALVARRGRRRCSWPTAATTRRRSIATDAADRRHRANFDGSETPTGTSFAAPSKRGGGRLRATSTSWTAGTSACCATTPTAPTCRT